MQCTMHNARCLMLTRVLPVGGLPVRAYAVPGVPPGLVRPGHHPRVRLHDCADRARKVHAVHPHVRARVLLHPPKLAGVADGQQTRGACGAAFFLFCFVCVVLSWALVVAFFVFSLFLLSVCLPACVCVCMFFVFFLFSSVCVLGWGRQCELS